MHKQYVIRQHQSGQFKSLEIYYILGPTLRTTYLKIIFLFFEMIGNSRIQLFLGPQGLTNNFKNVIKKNSNIESDMILFRWDPPPKVKQK